jgi:hypothetical protein
LIGVIVAVGAPDARTCWYRYRNRLGILDGDIDAAAVAVHTAMRRSGCPAGGRAAAVDVVNRAAIAGGFKRGAALAEDHAQAHRISRRVGVGPHHQQHGADVLLRVLGQMACVVDPGEAGMERLALDRAPEQPLLKGFILLRFFGVDGKMCARETDRDRESGEAGYAIHRDSIHGSSIGFA